MDIVTKPFEPYLLFVSVKVTFPTKPNKPTVEIVPFKLERNDVVYNLSHVKKSHHLFSHVNLLYFWL
jgi:hypothetical protein